MQLGFDKIAILLKFSTLFVEYEVAFLRNLMGTTNVDITVWVQFGQSNCFDVLYERF